MKIVGFSQLRNELENGNLHNWLRNMSEVCDVIYIYDQASDDGSQEVYKQYNTVVVQSDKNDFENELICKNLLLDEIKINEPDTDWIFWMDGDTLLDGRLNRRVIESIFTNNPNDGITLGHHNLWRSDIWKRVDDQYDYFHLVGRTPFWKFKLELYFPTESGLHKSQNEKPVGVNKTQRIPYNLIHRGFATDYQILKRYNLYKSKGQTGWALERLISEKTLQVEKINVFSLPNWFEIVDDETPMNKKRLTEQ